MMGDNAKSTGKPVNFQVQLAGNTVSGASYTVRVVKDGNLFSYLKATGSKTTMVEFTDTPAVSGRTYYRVEVEGGHQQPIFNGSEREHGWTVEPDLLQFRPELLIVTALIGVKLPLQKQDSS
jgi:hypothetical protein